MSKKTILNCILFLTIVAIIYGIWAIQPLSFDDWRITKLHLHTLFIQPPLPKTGQEIRYCFGASNIFPTNPFSFYKPWSLFTAIFLVSLLWVVFINESTLIRAGLILLTVLGFPYLGTIGPWNYAASQYAVPAAWLMLWYIVFRKIRYMNTRFGLRGILFFVLTFIVASWHEVWLITFFGIAAYFLFDGFSLLQKRDKSFKLRFLSVHLSVILAYILAVVFYTRGGPSKFIDMRGGISGFSASLMNWSHLTKALLLGTKENFVLIKDSLPIFLLIIYIKLNKSFKTKLSSDFRLFFAAALGSILFIYVGAFIFGAPLWRVRWLCVLSLSAALYALPKSNLIYRFTLSVGNFFIKAVRLCSILVAIIWLSYNVYFTYIYTNIDVAGWLQFRQMVLDRNPDVLKRPCCHTLPKNRPKGVATWNHEWGAQDDRYRFFMGPSDTQIYSVIKLIWDDQDIKK